MNEIENNDHTIEAITTIDTDKTETIEPSAWEKDEAENEQRNEEVNATETDSENELSKSVFEAKSDEKKDSELVEGFRSPHTEFEFGKEIAWGEEIKDKLDAASTAGCSPLDMVDAHSSVSEPLSEHPLGEDYEKWFTEEYGRHPWTETREAQEERDGKGE